MSVLITYGIPELSQLLLAMFWGLFVLFKGTLKARPECRTQGGRVTTLGKGKNDVITCAPTTRAPFSQS